MSERRRLLSNDQPQYVFESRAMRERKSRLRQFQCCVCLIFVCAVITAVVVGVSFGIAEETEVVPVEGENSSVVALLEMTWPLDESSPKMLYLDEEISNKMIESGSEGMKNFEEEERKSKEVGNDTASFRHQKTFAASHKAYRMSKLGHLQEILRKFQNQSGYFCFRLETNKSAEIQPDYCISTNNCNEQTKYQNFDGSCNNLQNPTTFGVAFRSFRRLLPPNYSNGVTTPKSANLPSARKVSTTIHRPYFRADPNFTVMLAVWGQFLDHDMTATAAGSGPNGATIECCPQPSHPDCFPVISEEGECMEFVRSAPAPTCCLGARQQMNQVSAYVDGSVVYGVDEEVARRLREMRGGLMKVYRTEDNRTLLPVSEDAADGCNRLEMSRKGRYCFMTGDGRANENLHLTSMHLIWIRQHNSIASKLSEINPNWSDEKLFLETRKIISAQLQHITYNEFLPVLFGHRLMRALDLALISNGYYYGYDETIDASISNVFATSAFRFAHSLIPGLMEMTSGNNTERIELHKMLLDPFALYEPGEMDRALNGAMNGSVQATDRYFTKELTQRLFEGRKRCGLDLVALNIQRGRDHGLPGYVWWREKCGLGRPKSFADLEGVVERDSLEDIMRIYKTVDDVDLYTASLSEPPLPGAILGPTLTCLLADQFIRTKRGDRFWYESPSSFTPGQLDALRQTSLAAIICDNSDAVRSVRPHVMRASATGNEKVSCARVARTDLREWRERVAEGKVRVGQEGVAVVGKGG